MLSILDDYSAIVLAQLWQVTLAALAVGLIIRTCCKSRPQLAYLLWMLVVVKSLTPPIVAHPATLLNWDALVEERLPSPWAREEASSEPPQEYIVRSSKRSEANALVRLDTNAAAPSREAVSASVELPMGSSRTVWRSLVRAIPSAAAVVWLIGATVIISVILRDWLRIRRQLLNASPAAADLQLRFERLRTQLRVSRSARLLITREKTVPAAFGLVRPTVVLPQDLVHQLSPAEIEPILAHELMHIRRWDLLAGRLQLASRIMWWFHPLVWWANREAHREREKCCDQQAIAALACRPADYARCLLNVLSLRVSSRSYLPAVAIAPVDLTARRLKDIMRSQPMQLATPTGHWLTALALAALIIPAAGSKQNSRLRLFPLRSEAQPLDSRPSNTNDDSANQRRPRRCKRKPPFRPTTSSPRIRHQSALTN